MRLRWQSFRPFSRSWPCFRRLETTLPDGCGLLRPSLPFRPLWWEDIFTKSGSPRKGWRRRWPVCSWTARFYPAILHPKVLYGPLNSRTTYGSSQALGGDGVPELRGILETALDVQDLAVSADFYRRALGLKVMERNERLCAFAIAGRDVLILFQRDEAARTLESAGGEIPPRQQRCEPLRVFGGSRGIRTLGARARRQRRSDRKPREVAARRQERLLSRPGRAPRRTGDTGNLVCLLRACKRLRRRRVRREPFRFRCSADFA